MNSILRLFGRPSSSNTQKILWMLRETKQPFELILASARLGEASQHLCEQTGGKPYGVVDTEEYRRMCPTRQIPCLIDGELALWESHSILRYLAQKYKPELHLGDARGMARCSPWMDWVLASSFNMGCNHDIIDQMARTPLQDRDFELVASCHAGYIERMQLIEEQLASTQGFLVGDKLTIADIPIGCELARWSCSLENWSRDAQRGLAPRLPAMPSFPHLASFFERLQERSAFRDGCFAPERTHHNLPQAGERIVRLFDYDMLE